MELQAWPSVATATLYNSWGLDISYMVNWSISPDQYKQITGKDYQAPTK